MKEERKTVLVVSSPWIMLSLIFSDYMNTRWPSPSESESVSRSVESDCLQTHGLYSSPVSSVHGISQARILEWVAISFSRGSSRPRNWTQVSCTGKWILYHWATREVHLPLYTHKKTLCPPWWLSWWRLYPQRGRPGFNPWVGKIPWRREWQPTPVFWPGEFHGQGSLAAVHGVAEESDTTEWLSLSLSDICVRETRGKY